MSARKITRRIAGMHCIRCENTVKAALSRLPGLENVSVSYSRGTMTADWDEAQLPEARIRECLRAAGYDFRETRTWVELLKLAGLLLACCVLFDLIRRNPLVSRLNLFPTAESGMGLGALFLIGLTTALHCLAMCGGINLSQSGHGALRGGELWRSNLQYNLGRLVSYTLTGCIVGALGSVFSISLRTRTALMLVAALFMVVMACNLSGLFPWMQRLSIHLPKTLSARLPRPGGSGFSFGVGLLNGLMPCGPLQSMQLFALSVGNWWMGGLSMLCFAAGTIPAMLGFGVLGGALNRRFGRPLQWISAALVLLMGMGMLVNAASFMGISAARPSETGLTAQLSADGSVQTITTELEWNRYPDFTVYAGIPLQWTMHASPDKLIGCNNEILIPAYGLDIPLQAGDNLIAFTPAQDGEIAYSCWMGMMRATITVIEAYQQY